MRVWIPQSMPILTEIRIRAARPKERAYKLFDLRGLFMLVTPTGGRLWRFKYRMNGVEKLLTLGRYPDVSLKRAREKRDDARKLVADNVDPSVKRQAEWTLRLIRSRLSLRSGSASIRPLGLTRRFRFLRAG